VALLAGSVGDQVMAYLSVMSESCPGSSPEPAHATWYPRDLTATRYEPDTGWWGMARFMVGVGMMHWHWKHESELLRLRGPGSGDCQPPPPPAMPGVGPS
jgi:hypothetical protein